jgi:hypothetical protein
MKEKLDMYQQSHDLFAEVRGPTNYSLLVQGHGALRHKVRAALRPVRASTLPHSARILLVLEQTKKLGSKNSPWQVTTFELHQNHSSFTSTTTTRNKMHGLLGHQSLTSMQNVSNPIWRERITSRSGMKRASVHGASIKRKST